MNGALYNEIDPYAAEWTERLIAAGHIAPGRVERRSIADLSGSDVAGGGQRHFFSGIAVWSYALRMAGVPDDLGVWTGSCPCQPFSDAGKGKALDDDRHLWPEWFRLIKLGRPAGIFGEQVASRAGLGWLDLVRADLEGAGYAFGAADLPAAGLGAPHKRSRLFFCAYARGFEGRLLATGWRPRRPGPETERSGEAVDGRNPGSAGSGRNPRAVHRAEGEGEGEGERLGAGAVAHQSVASGLPLNGDDTERTRLEGLSGHERDGRGPGWLDPVAARSAAAAGATRGFWGGCDWYFCRDGKYRPIGPGIFPLAHGAPSRVGRLRAYGNAIVAQVAATFITASLEAMTSPTAAPTQESP